MNYNIYCDESCHLKNDNSTVMILGAITCPSDRKSKIFDEIREIKLKYKLDSRFEIKWTKVSYSKIDFYLELLNYIVNNEDLQYRGLVATGKEKLNHDVYNMGDPDLWYYKMYFLMLDPIVNPTNEYKILVDIKDTNGGKRVEKLREVLCNNKYDFRKEVIKHIVQINSKESEILQLTDLINGALGYYHRKLFQLENANRGKIEFVNKLKNIYNLNVNSCRCETKFNLFIWKPRVQGGDTWKN